MREDISVERLSDTETLMAEVLNNIFDGVYIVDTDRNIIFWNAGAEEMTGYNYGEVMGRRCSDNILNHIDENGTLLCKDHCPLVESLKTGEHIKAKVYPLHKSGKRFPVMTHIYPIRDGGDNIIAAIEIFRDMSQEEEYRKLQDKFNTIIKRYVSSVTFDEAIAKAHTGIEHATRKLDRTIMFLDVVGFTTLSEKYSTEKVVGVLNELFGVCDIAVRENNGYIDKFIGDAVMAVFVDADDAVSAAENILFSFVPMINERRTGRGEEPIRVRIGLNSGILIQGDIGTGDRKDLTVVGDVVNTASRIESKAEPGSIYISESTFSRLKDPSNYEYVGKDRLKGKAEVVVIYRFKKQL